MKSLISIKNDFVKRKQANIRVESRNVRSAFNANIRLFMFQEIINVGLKKRAQMQ